MNLKIKLLFGISFFLLCVILLTVFGQKKSIGRDETTGQNLEMEIKTDSEKVPDSELVTESEDFFIEETEENLAEAETDTTIEDILENMTLEEKIAQMFIITPEALTGYGTVTSAGGATKEALEKYPVGGLIYFAKNIQSKEQVIEMTGIQQQYSLERIGLPLFISVDEEGGSVARVANESPISVKHFSDMASIAADPNALSLAGELGDEIGSYLKELGFNLDFAPVADVLTNPDNTVVKRRSFGTDAVKTAELAAEVSKHLEGQGVYSCLKHFPGHGATAGDSHKGFSYTDKTLDKLREAELIPFYEGIASGVSFVMVGHISAPNITGDDMPATLSKILVTDVLRKEMQFDGIIITDAMNMGAICSLYSSREAAKLAVSAGIDMILMPADFKAAYEGLLEAVKEGAIDEERIDESVRRIVEKKLKKGAVG